MRAVWKYTVPVDGDFHEVEMPIISTVVHVGNQGRPDEVVFWVEVDSGSAVTTRCFTVVGTGHRIRPGVRYLGTTQAPSGLVWHLYEVERS